MLIIQRVGFAATNMNKLCNEALLDSRNNWFQFPEVVRLAADTFSRAITCYTPDQQNTTFVSYFSILLQLHASHFYLIEAKLDSKPRWPPKLLGHIANCSSNPFTNYSILYNNQIKKKKKNYYAYLLISGTKFY